MQILERRGVHIGAHILSVHNITDAPFDPVTVDKKTLQDTTEKEFPVLNDDAGAKMRTAIAEAKTNKDSVGGIVECAVAGLPVGLGEPIFDGLESRLSTALFAIPAVKGVEFGEGFRSATLYGSENNDAFFYDSDGMTEQEVLNELSLGIKFCSSFVPKPPWRNPWRHFQWHAPDFSCSF